MNVPAVRMLCLLVACLSRVVMAALIIESEERFFESAEHIGASVSHVTRHPYAASLLRNGTYVCSATILNERWLLTAYKCTDPEANVSNAKRHLTVRVGSPYNYKEGDIYKVQAVKSSEEEGVAAIKLRAPLVFSPSVHAAWLPHDQSEKVVLGHLVTMLAWTPSGHLRAVNAPNIEPRICEAYSQQRRFLCVGGVQDPDRQFCRNDNGGAVMQNNTVVAVTTFIRACAHYGKAHAFPKIPVTWLNSIIWDEQFKPTTQAASVSLLTADINGNITSNASDSQGPIPQEKSKKYILTIPYYPLKVPLEPSPDNSVKQKTSMYEAFLEQRRRANMFPSPPNHTIGVTLGENVPDERDKWLKMYSEQFNNYKQIQDSGMLSPFKKTFEYEYDYNV